MNKNTLSWLLSSWDNFASLLGKLILWPREHKNYTLSGFVTAALLDFEEINNEKYTILAINQLPSTNLAFNKPWMTYKLTRENLLDFLSGNPEIVGKKEEDTYFLKSNE
jgi:hypothetical protein